LRRARARADGWPTAPGSGSSSARASAALAFAALAVAGCGHQQQQQPAKKAPDLLAQAQQGLRRIHSGTVTIHARADTPIPLDRTETVPARDVPFSAIRLTRWTRKPHRVPCGPKLECVRGRVAVREALRDLSPLLPSLPVDPSSVHDAEVEVALRDHKPVSLKLSGQVDAGFLLGDVPFEVVLDLPRAT
jgi:hypothetical protein